MNKYYPTIETAFKIIKSRIQLKITEAKIIDFEPYDCKAIIKLNNDLNEFYSLSNQKKVINILEEVRNISSILKKRDIKLSLATMYLIDFINSADLSDHQIDEEMTNANIPDSEYDTLWFEIKKLIKSEGIELTEWVVVDGHCAARYLVGEDQSEIKNTMAFIEKTPRIRLLDFSNKDNERLAWLQGYKGAGGSEGDNPDNELYGFYPKSREWCDEILTKLGYKLN